tara:strand:- start:1067 stop:2263 length:1197 start_codon:yes stop_codon:yes gene_type:complete
MHTAELEQSLNESKVFPMVKDLSYKYDLRVSQRLIIRKYRYDGSWQRGFSETKNYDRFNYINFNPKQDEELKKQENETSDSIRYGYEEAFILDYQGIPQALVYVDDDDKFCFQANYHIKDRGRDSWDRYTITSNKVSQVLKTLRRKEWKPLGSRDNYQAMRINTEDMVNAYAVDNVSLSTSISAYKNAINDLTYENKDKLSEVLENLYGSKNSISHATNEHYTKQFASCSNLKDRVHSIYNEIKVELDNKFTAIGITNSGGWIVGEAYDHQGDFKVPNGQDTYYEENDRYARNQFKTFNIEFGNIVIHKTQRVRNLEQLDFFDSLKPTLTMLKVRLQDWKDKEDRNEVVRDYFRNEYSNRYNNNNWIEELGCYYAENTVYGANNNPYSITWLLMAKSQ